MTDKLCSSEEEVKQLRADLAAEREHSARLVEALEHFAILASDYWDEHPCLTRCPRVGEPTKCPNGECVECGLRTLGDDEVVQWRGHLGDLRRARAALDAAKVSR